MAKHTVEPMATPSSLRPSAKDRTRKYSGVAIICSLSLVAAIGCGGFALASVSDVAGAENTASDKVVVSSTEFVDFDSSAASEDFVLDKAVTFDMSAPIAEAQAEEEAARKAAEEAARKAEEEAIARAQANAQSTSAGISTAEVDFTIGREAFIAEWTDRINAYLSGSPLAGYGESFATAAWEAGIDPRWSPAISNTESSKGAHCFASHNAWGWTGGSWSDWDTAIHAHVQGLAKGYGFTISKSAAYKYCPPNAEHWYSATLSEMRKI